MTEPNVVTVDAEQFERMKNCPNCCHFVNCPVAYLRKKVVDLIKANKVNYSPCYEWKLVDKK